MDELLSSDTLDPSSEADGAVVEQTSAEYLGRWNRLVSTTNWEKGRIISQWRMQLVEAGAPASAYSDEAWSRRVGNVSPQHVGRLRRVFEQFGESYPLYDGLYWSHFLASLDWPDAEMWLEGARQNGWSVSDMRSMRGQTLDGVPGQQPENQDVAETDEDAQIGSEPTIAGSMGVVTDPGVGEPSLSDDSSEAEPFCEALGEASEAPFDEDPPPQPVRPFENLPSLPSDLQDAFETFKLAILSHKVSGWQEVTCDAVLATLDALKQLAVAPSVE